MNITVVGAGFVGKATGMGLAKHGNKVFFVDADEKRVKQLREEGLDAHTPQQYTAIKSDVSMFCVPTPTEKDKIQLHFLKNAITDFAELLKNHKKYHVVVARSTVPPLTCRGEVLPLIEKISGKKVGKDFGLVMQPEYLREATAEDDFARPWFVLVGGYDKKSSGLIEKLYQPFDAPIVQCSLEEAEFQKYVHNVFNAVKIAFFNEMRVIAKREGWDADTVFTSTAESCEGMWNPLYGTKDFGPFDGSCLPKDSRALLEWGDARKYNLGILRAVIQENLRHEKMLGKNQKVRVNYLERITV